MNEISTSTVSDRISRLELIVAGVVAAIMLGLVVAEPEILEAPFENGRSILFTVGGTVLAAIAFAVMVRFRVPAVVRVVVLLVPFVAVNWWLLSPYFVDDVVDDDFATSISDQLARAEDDSADTDGAADAATIDEASDAAAVDDTPADTPAVTSPQTDDSVPLETTPPAGPVLLGAGGFVGLAGHSGTGDAGVFENPDGSLVLRFENFDIQNGPDLEVYLVPGADQTSVAEGAIHLGALKGNVGDQSYEFAPGTELAAGPWTALVWCEAFTVEFVGATISI